jgi:acetyl-CoA carboxylase biotin carboxyl carrier protein
LKKSTNKKSAGPDLSKLNNLIGFMKENDLVELDFSEGAASYRLRRRENSSGSLSTQILGTLAPSNSQATVAQSTQPSRKFQLITSPFVGTFYSSPGPNQDPFVKEGSTIGVGDTLCIIEAMKLMNEIESDVKGRIMKILVNNGTPVEFGEPLFEIEPL